MKPLDNYTITFMSRTIVTLNKRRIAQETRSGTEKDLYVQRVIHFQASRYAVTRLNFSFLLLLLWRFDGLAPAAVSAALLPATFDTW